MCVEHPCEHTKQGMIIQFGWRRVQSVQEKLQLLANKFQPCQIGQPIEGEPASSSGWLRNAMNCPVIVL